MTSLLRGERLEASPRLEGAAETSCQWCGSLSATLAIVLESLDQDDPKQAANAARSALQRYVDESGFPIGENDQRRLVLASRAPRDGYLLFVNSQRTSLLRAWPRGGHYLLESASRAHPSHTWGPPQEANFVGSEADLRKLAAQGGLTEERT